MPRLPRRSGAASRASRAPKPSPSAPPSAMCTTPATQNDGRCEGVPRLPRERTVDVSLCHACHTKCVAKCVCLCACGCVGVWACVCVCLCVCEVIVC